MHLAEIWRYPVKSMAGERLDRVTAGPSGITGDRVVQVYDGRGRLVTARTHPRLLGLRATLGADGEPMVDGRPWASRRRTRARRGHRRAGRAAGAQRASVAVRHPAAARRDRWRHRRVRTRRPAPASQSDRWRRRRSRRAGVGGPRAARGPGARRARRSARAVRHDDRRSRHPGPGPARAEGHRAPLRRPAGAQRRGDPGRSPARGHRGRVAAGGRRPASGRMRLLVTLRDRRAGNSGGHRVGAALRSGASFGGRGPCRVAPAMGT